MSAVKSPFITTATSGLDTQLVYSRWQHMPNANLPKTLLIMKTGHQNKTSVITNSPQALNTLPASKCILGHTPQTHKWKLEMHSKNANKGIMLLTTSAMQLLSIVQMLVLRKTHYQAVFFYYPLTSKVVRYEHLFRFIQRSPDSTNQIAALQTSHQSEKPL